MNTSVVSPGNKGTNTLFHNCSWLTTFVLELGKAVFQLEVNRNKDNLFSIHVLESYVEKP